MVRLGLAVIVAAAAATGCANAPGASALAFGKSWRSFAAQAANAAEVQRTATTPPGPTGPAGPAAEEWEQFDDIPQAGLAVRRARQTLEQGRVSRQEARKVLQDLEAADRALQGFVARDPQRAADLRARLAELRAYVEDRLEEISAIEPYFDLGKRHNVRVAVARIGEGIEPVRHTERVAWREFLASAGFSGDVVFVDTPLVGPEPSPADLRVAAARLGADALVVYTTTSATDASPIGTSAAVLAFAKCLMIDTRSEYLYLNAEGESRRTAWALPFAVDLRSLELESIAAASAALRTEFAAEITRTLARGQ